MLIETDIRLTVRAVQVFGDAQRAENWLRSPNRLFQGQTPLEALKTLDGAAEVEKQLNWFAGKRAEPLERVS